MTTNTKKEPSAALPKRLEDAAAVLDDPEDQADASSFDDETLDVEVAEDAAPSEKGSDAHVSKEDADQLLKEIYELQARVEGLTGERDHLNVQLNANEDKARKELEAQKTLLKEAEGETARLKIKIDELNERISAMQRAQKEPEPLEEDVMDLKGPRFSFRLDLRETSGDLKGKLVHLGTKHEAQFNGIDTAAIGKFLSAHVPVQDKRRSDAELEEVAHSLEKKAPQPSAVPKQPGAPESPIKISAKDSNRKPVQADSLRIDTNLPFGGKGKMRLKANQSFDFGVNMHVSTEKVLTGQSITALMDVYALSAYSKRDKKIAHVAKPLTSAQACVQVDARPLDKGIYKLLIVVTSRYPDGTPAPFVSFCEAGLVFVQ